MDTVSDGNNIPAGSLRSRRAATKMGPKPALSIERIADVAMTIADNDGIGAVSMQRVAAEFDYTKMSLYRYVAGKDELVAAMIDRAVGEPPVLADVDGDWRRQLEEWTRLLAATWQQHPWLPPATMGDREMGPNEIGWIECAIDTLADTSLRPAEQMAAVLLICGHLRNTQSTATAGTQPWSGRRQRQLIREHGERFPALSRVLDGATNASSDRGRAFGMTCILDGLESIIASRARRAEPTADLPAPTT